MDVDGLSPCHVLWIRGSEHLNRLLLLILFLFLFRWSFQGEAADLRRRQQLRLHQWELYRCMYLETVNKPTCSDTHHMVCMPQDWWTHVGPVPEALASTLPHTHRTLQWGFGHSFSQISLFAGNFSVTCSAFFAIPCQCGLRKCYFHFLSTTSIVWHVKKNLFAY